MGQARLAVFAFTAAIVGVSGAVNAAVTYNVNSTLDNPDQTINGVCADINGKCTLRAAVMEADFGPNPTAEQITINLPAGPFMLTGELSVIVSLKIVGAGVGLTIVDANHADRAFEVTSAGSLFLSGMTIRNGTAAQNGQELGGAIWARGPLSLVGCAVETSSAGNVGIGYGGGIFAESTYPGPPAAVLLLDTTISGNASHTGGGLDLYNRATVIQHSTLSFNSAFHGAGVFVEQGSLKIENSTLHQNNATDSGGGLLVLNATATLSYTTLGFNAADADQDSYGSGGGIFAGPGSYVVIKNCVLQNVNDFTRENDDCSGSVVTITFNILSSSAGCDLAAFAYVIADPLLGPLKDNGGPTLTEIPGALSPAIEAGSYEGCQGLDGLTLAVDQRGVKRPIGSKCDLGAIEVGVDVAVRPVVQAT